jgi:hypothetical protein
VKITPINFSNLIEPHIEEYWGPRKDTSNGKIQIERSHNLRLVQTTVNVFYAPNSGDAELLMSVQLVDIPQQEEYSAVNATIHVPGLDSGKQVLMIFKKELDVEIWCKKLVDETKAQIKLASKMQAVRDAEAAAREDAAQQEAESSADSETA